MTGPAAGDRRAELAQQLLTDAVPEHLHAGLLNYLVDHRPVGGFLLAVLENNLALAIARNGGSGADLERLVRFLVNYARFDAWGSVEAVSTWLVGGGRS